MRALLALLILLAATPLARAASPEEAYIAARDHAIAVLKRAPAGRIDGEERRLRGALAARLRRLVGVARLTGFPRPATMSPDTLLASDVGFGALDGVSFATKDDAGEALVTTEDLLTRWLAAHAGAGKDKANTPADPRRAFRSEAFYTQAVSADAAVSIFASLPIDKPDGAALAVALLVQQSQDLAIGPPGQIAVALVKGGRVFIAIVNADAKPAPISRCEAVWRRFKSRSEAARKAYDDSGLKDQKRFDASTRLESAGAEALHKCWFERAKGEAAFPALTRQAQALADQFAAQ